LKRHVHSKVDTNEIRPKSSGLHILTKSVDEFQSNSTSTNFSFASDDEYDTDLEDDPHPISDYSCLGIYKRTCQHEQLVPVGPYLRHCNEKELPMSYYGLGSKAMRGFIPSLTVDS
jgi:hypothetical protein